MPATSENKALARSIPEEIVTEGNIDRLDEVCAPDVRDYSPLGDLEGIEAMKEQFRGIRAGFSDFSATVEDIVSEGDTVAMRLTLRGTHDGEFMGIEPTGNAVEIDNMVFTHIADGKVVERRVVPDLLGVMQQVGTVDLPATK